MKSQDKSTVSILEAQLHNANEKLKSKDHEEKLLGASETLDSLASFLKANYPTVPTTPIVKMLKEISDIKNGVNPKIFRTDKKTSGGRPAPISDHYIKAVIAAAIEILMEGAKLKKSDALEKVSKSLKGYMTTTQLDTLRRKVNKDGIDSFFQYKKEGLASDNPVAFALSALETASKYLE